jgi:hypothetical protein
MMPWFIAVIGLIVLSEPIDGVSRTLTFLVGVGLLVVAGLVAIAYGMRDGDDG